MPALRDNPKVSKDDGAQTTLHGLWQHQPLDPLPGLPAQTVGPVELTALFCLINIGQVFQVPSPQEGL